MAFVRAPRDHRDQRPEEESPRSWGDRGQDILRIGPDVERPAYDLIARGIHDRASEIRTEFYEKRQALHYLRTHIPQLEAQLLDLEAARGGADDIRLLQHNIDLANHQRRALEVDVSAKARQLAELGEDHSVD
jgi:hypothetical protein